MALAAACDNIRRGQRARRATVVILDSKIRVRQDTLFNELEREAMGVFMRQFG
jgi:hypothetical protein